MAKTARNSRKNTRKTSRKASRKTAKSSRKAGDWASAVKRVYEEMKRKNSNASLGDAMKEASRRRKAGNL